MGDDGKNTREQVSTKGVANSKKNCHQRRRKKWWRWLLLLLSIHLWQRISLLLLYRLLYRQQQKCCLLLLYNQKNVWGPTPREKRGPYNKKKTVTPKKKATVIPRSNAFCLPRGRGKVSEIPFPQLKGRNFDAATTNCLSQSILKTKAWKELTDYCHDHFNLGCPILSTTVLEQYFAGHQSYYLQTFSWW